jgi:phage repressor protein C with HTH and peptisase S24 domain
MISHTDLWRGLEELARRQGCSISGLARRAGLDATTFNRSKRQTAQGRPRWPSTESLARVLEVTGIDLAAFAALAQPPILSGTTRADDSPPGGLPLIDQDRACRDIPFDDEGLPVGQGWDLLPFPVIDDPHCFILELTDDRAAPIYQAGDHLVISPAGSLAALVRRGDRLVVGTVSGELHLVELIRQSPRRLDLRRLGGDQPITIAREDIRWMGRIVWVNQ